MNQRLRAIVLMVAASAFLQLPVSSPALRMLSPLMLAHAGPNDEPRPTRTPRPPEPTDTPRPTRTPPPTRAPEATDTPKPTRTPTSILQPPPVSDFRVNGWLFGSDTSAPSPASGRNCSLEAGVPANCFSFSGWFRVPRGVTVLDPTTQPTQFSLIAVGPGGGQVTLANTGTGATTSQPGSDVTFRVTRNVKGTPTIVRFKARRTHFAFCTVPPPATPWPASPTIPCVNSLQCTTPSSQCIGLPVTKPAPTSGSVRVSNVQLILSASVDNVGFTQTLTCNGTGGAGDLRCSK